MEYKFKPMNWNIALDTRGRKTQDKQEIKGKMHDLKSDLLQYSDLKLSLTQYASGPVLHEYK